MSVRILERVIETRLERRGVGSTEDPIRCLTQYWTEDGVLLAEVDPFPPGTPWPTGSKADG